MGNSGRNHDPAMTGWNAPIPNLRTLTPKRRGSTQAAVRRACAIRASNPTRQAAVARIMPGSCKARTHARLAQAQHRLFADQVQRVAEPDRRRRLAFAGRGRGDGGHQDQLGVGPGGQRADRVERDLRLVFAGGLHGIGRHAEFIARDRADRLHRGFPRYLDIGFRVSVLLFSARHGVSP